MNRTLKDYLEDMWNAAKEALEFTEKKPYHEKNAFALF